MKRSELKQIIRTVIEESIDDVYYDGPSGKKFYTWRKGLSINKGDRVLDARIDKYMKVIDILEDGIRLEDETGATYKRVAEDDNRIYNVFK